MTELQGPEQVLYDLLAQHESLGPKQAADALGWNKDQVAQAKEGLKAKGLISTRQGGGMQVAQPHVVASTHGVDRNAAQAPEPKAYKPTGRQAKGSAAQGAQASKPLGQPATKPLSHKALSQQAQQPNAPEPQYPKWITTRARWTPMIY